MSEADVAVMRRWFDLWNRAELDAFIATFGPDAEVITDPSWMEAGPFRGRAAIGSWYEGLKESWDTQRVALGEVFEADDRVLARLEWKVRGRTSGIETTLNVTAINTIEDGQIVRQQFYFDHGAALRAVGLQE